MKDRKAVRIDPNRKHTLAEVRLVMEVYGCDEARARAILKIRLPLQRREEIRGMVDALLVEQAIAEGRILRTPAWLLKSNSVLSFTGKSAKFSFTRSEIRWCATLDAIQRGALSNHVF